METGGLKIVTTISKPAEQEMYKAVDENIAAQPGIFVGVMTEKMLTYALGRGVRRALEKLKGRTSRSGPFRRPG